MPSPRVLIAGAGAMGSLFGGLLAEHGLDVVLFSKNARHMDAIHTDGLRIVGEGGDRTVKIAATADPQAIGQADIVLFQCKAQSTMEVCRATLPAFGPETIAISFQNGLGNEEMIATLVPEERVLGGLTALGATLEAPGIVRNYASVPTIIGEMWGKSTSSAPETAAILTAHGIATTVSDHIRADKWRKLMLNVAMSATSGLTGLSIGEVAGHPRLAVIARRAMDEAAAVAACEGINLPEGERYAIFDAIVASGAARNKTSMRRDIEAGRRTEVEAIYGVVIERGRKAGIATPTLDTLAALIAGAEHASCA